ncbi:MAG: Ail/Lom family outer membrane beta-barrel protein [Serratia proteamaculans]
MKKTMLTLLVAGCMAASAGAMAAQQTVTLGYAQSHIQHEGPTLRGVNAQYRYEFNDAWGVMGSFTWMSGDETTVYHYSDGYKGNDDIDAKYYSLLAGPTYRINNWVSLYGNIGFAVVDMDEDYKESNGVNSYRLSYSENSTAFAWGVGVIVNPMDNLSVSVGYEGTTAEVAGDHYGINGFNLGVGYSF